RPIALSHFVQECLSLMISHRCHSALYGCLVHDFLPEVSHGSLARVQVPARHSRCGASKALRARGSPSSNSILLDLASSQMVQGILMALLWLPAVLVLVWLPAATRRRLDAAAQATVTAVRRQRGSPARGPLPMQDLLIAGLGIVLLLLLVLTLLSGCADYTCWAAHQFAGAHYGRQPGVCPPPPDTTVQAGGQP